MTGLAAAWSTLTKKDHQAHSSRRYLLSVCRGWNFTVTGRLAVMFPTVAVATCGSAVSQTLTPSQGPLAEWSAAVAPNAGVNYRLCLSWGITQSLYRLAPASKLGWRVLGIRSGRYGQRRSLCIILQPQRSADSRNTGPKSFVIFLPNKSQDKVRKGIINYQSLISCGWSRFGTSFTFFGCL